MADDSTRTANYYDRIAGAYDGQVDGVEANRAARRAFRERVAALTPAGGTILDFGCGTGADAEWYIERGFRVVAYDVSAGMVDRLRARCAAAIAAGEIVAVAGDVAALRHALAGAPGSRTVATVAADFGVLSHFADLDAALRDLAALLAPGGAIVASLLSAAYAPDLRRPWWWKGMPRALVGGAITCRGDVWTHRFPPRALRRAAPSLLRLTTLEGLPVHEASSPIPVRLTTLPRLLRTPFWLAVWVKR